MKKSILRIVSMVLSIALIVGCINIGVFASDNSGTIVLSGSTSVNVTDAQIIAGYYDFLSDAEKAVLECTALVGDTHTITSPTDSDNLITVDKENKTVKAESFTDENGNTWNPVSAEVVVDQVSHAIALSNGEGSFASVSGDKYTVNVTYELKVAIDTDMQQTLVNAPAYLANGIVNMEAIAAMSGDFELIATVAIDELYKLHTGEYKVQINGSSRPITIADGAARDAIVDLYNDRAEHNGVLGIMSLIEEYEAAENKLAYLLENGEEFKAAFERVYNNLVALCMTDDASTEADETSSLRKILNSIDTFVSMGLVTESVANQLKKGLSILETTRNKMATVNSDNWAVLEQDLVTEGADLTALNEAVCALAENGTVALHNETLDAEVVYKNVTLSQGVDQYTLTFIVKANVVKGTDTTKTETISSTETVSLTFDKNTSAEEVIDAVLANGILDRAVAEWAADEATKGYDIDMSQAHYIVTCDELPETITEVATYTLLFEPLTYSLDLCGNVMEVPYGYQCTLPTYASVNGDASKSYDYTVNGKAMREGVVYRVVGETTITRVEGEATEKVKLPEVVANSSKPGATLTAEAKAILYASAIKGDYLYFRTPTDKLELVELTSIGATYYKVTAKELASGLTSGAVWTATSGYLVDKENNKIENVEITFENGEGEFEYSGDFKEVKVEYELVVKDVATSVVDDYINLPKTLVDEATAQKNLLSAVVSDSMYQSLGEVNSKYNLVFAVISEEQGFSAESVAAAAKMKSECVDTVNKSFYLYQYITSYRNEGGLAWLYAEGNAEKMQEQIIALAEALGVIAKDDAFGTLLSELGYSEYANMVDDIVAKLDNVVANIDVLDVNPYIDRTSAYLDALVTTIENATGKVADFATGNELVLSATLGAVSSGSKKITVNVGVINSAGDADAANKFSDSLTFAVDYVLTQADITDINNLIASLNANLTIDKNLYEAKTVGTLPSAGDTISANIDITITWQPKSYTVKIDGEEDVVIKSDSPKITLPVCNIGGSKYVYTIAGKQYAQGATVTFTADELNTLFVNNTLVITRETVVIAREDIINFTNDLNAALAPAGITVSAFENANGNIALVLNINGSAVAANQSALTKAASDMAQVVMAYEYIGIGNEAFWDGSVLSIQTIIDAVTNSGFGFDVICDAIDANGNFVSMKLDGYKVISNAGVIGAEMVATSVELDTATNTYPLYVTVSGGDSATLLQLKEAVATIKNYINVECVDGECNVTVNVPNAVYAVYLTQMLLSEKADLEDVTAMDTEEALRYELSLIEALINDDNFTIETLETTFAKVGKNVDLSEYEQVFNAGIKLARYVLNNFELNGTEYAGTFSYAIRSALIQAGIPENLLGVIKEAQANSEGISVDASVNFVNLNEEHDALVFDYSAEGILNKYYVTDNLASALAGLGNNSVVVLLSDVELSKAVTISNNAFINLNGFTITGDMNASGTVRIMDSRVGTENAGGVDGKLTGNFVITSGTYTSDISSMLAKGFSVNDNGYVCNDLYSVVDDGKGNVTIELSADFLNRANFPEIKALLVDAAVDVALNMYTSSAISVDGNNIYSVEVKDVVGYLDSTKTDLANTALDFIDWAGLTTTINTVIEDVCDFGALASAIKAGDALATYELSAKTWTIGTRIADGNYITLDIIPSEEAQTGTLSVVVKGTDEEKAALVELCEKLEDTVDVKNVSIIVTDVSYNGGLDVTYEATADVTVDLSCDNNYGALVGVAVAYSMADGAQKDALVSALEVYFTSGETEDLLAALENVSAAQVIAALKALVNTTCEDMLTSLGLTSEKSEAVVKLEAVWGDLIDIAGLVLGKLDITGPATTLKGFKVDGTYATYTFERENVKGYNVDVALSLKLFSEAGDITIEEPVVDLETSKEVIAGYEVSDGILFLDTKPEGLTAEEINHVIFKATNADKIDVTVLDREGNERTGRICNGDTVMVVASNAKGSVTATYTIIIMGDTNADGVINIGDAYAVAQHYTGVITLDEAGMLAADMNQDNAINIGDTYKMAIKYTSWNSDDDTYSSNLEQK